MKAEQAENLAIQALGWLASEDDLLNVFMGSAGVSADELKARAAEPELLAAVLDFILMDDTWVKGFCNASAQPFDAPLRARALLPGGDIPHWT